MPEKLHRCVDKVKGTGVDNPWAVCNASLKELEDMVHHSTDAPMAREHDGHFSKPRGSIHEGGQGSGRKQKGIRGDPAHIGWKNYGIDAEIDKAEKDYLTKERSLDEIIND